MIPGFDLDAFVTATLAEDMGEGGDRTSAAVIPAEAMLTAVMDSRDAVVVAGLPLAEAFFRKLDPACQIETLVAEGQSVPAGADLMRIRGNARALLTAERSALNTVQHLTGIATIVGEDSFVLGSDYPHGDPSRQEDMVGEFRDRKDLSQTMVEKMLSANPKRLYGF